MDKQHPFCVVDGHTQDEVLAILPDFEKLYQGQLPNLLLRCDEVNHWNARNTLFYLLKSSMPPRPFPDQRSLYYNLVVPRLLNLDNLALPLSIPKGLLIATTYLEELVRCYGISAPFAWQLSTSFSLHVCPQCVAESRLLKRKFLLPHIRSCQIHHLKLVRVCTCSTQLNPFFPSVIGNLPFTCYTCDLKLEHKYLSYYNFFLTHGNPELLNRAWQILRKRVQMEKEEIFPPDRRNEFWRTLHRPVKTEILCVLVAALVFFNISPNDILVYKHIGSSIREKLGDYFIDRIYYDSIFTD